MIPVFLNDLMLQVPEGSSLGQLLALHDAELLRDLLAGGVIATDGRGVPVDSDAALNAGAILRVRRSARSAPPGSNA